MYLYQEAEKFIKDIFWSETHNKNGNINLPEIIKERLIKDNKEKDPDYYVSRDGIVHVSYLSKCLRGVVLEMLGVKKDEKDESKVARQLGVFKAGNLFEDFIVDALGDLMQDRQTEYVYKYKNIIITGRDDGTILKDGIYSMLEAKSVHSDSFWYREQEGTLVASHNQMQIQTYLWLRRILPNFFIVHTKDEPVTSNLARLYTNFSEQEVFEYTNYEVYKTIDKPDNSELNGVFSYVSKDDCTVIGAPVKFNQRIIDETVIPALDIICEGYEKLKPLYDKKKLFVNAESENAGLIADINKEILEVFNKIPAPDLAVYSDTMHQYQKNWLCTYCDYHSRCAGAGWLLEATNLVSAKNKELKEKAFGAVTSKPKPIIGVAN